jgi:hypothetical protein
MWRDLDFNREVVAFRRGFVSGRIARLKAQPRLVEYVRQEAKKRP